MNSLNIDTCISRDSISSNHGEDSHRSSTPTLSRTHARFNNKKIMIDQKIFNKLINFLSAVIKEMNLNLEEFKEIKILSEYVQTQDASIISKLEEDKEEVIFNYRNQINELNNKIIKLRKELEEVNNQNYLLIEENKRYKEENEKLINRNQSIKEENQKLLGEYESLKQEMEEIKSHENNTIKNMRSIEKNNSHQFSDNKQENSHTGSINLIEVNKLCLSDSKVLKNISVYLNPCEYILLSHTNTAIKNILQNDNSLIDQLKKSIEFKNCQISNLQSFDWNKEYDISDVEIERLIKEYININKIPGIDLKNLLINALNYIRNDIKAALGIVSQPQLEPENQSKRSNGILNSLNNVFNKFVNKKVEVKNIKNDSPGSFENISQYDNYLITVKYSINLLRIFQITTRLTLSSI